MPPKHKPVPTDLEAADLLSEEPKKPPITLPRCGVWFKYGSILSGLVLSIAMLTFCVVMEQKEEAIEQQVALLTKTQLKNAHRTGRMLNRLLTRESDSLGPSFVTDSDVGALCKSKKCGLTCAHGKTAGYATFLDSLTQNLPNLLNLIPGIGSQLSSLSQMAIGVSDSISKSDGFKLNGRECAAEMLEIFRLNRATALKRGKGYKEPLLSEAPETTGQLVRRGKRSTVDSDPLRLSKRTRDENWQLRFKRQAGLQEDEDERLRDLLEQETGFSLPHTSDHSGDLMSLLSYIFATLS